MPKYRKKPVIIEARQWNKHGDHKEVRPSPSVCPRSSTDKCGRCGSAIYDHGRVDTLEGILIVCPGDYIITGVRGEVYPCKPDIFMETYELVEE